MDDFGIREDTKPYKCLVNKYNFYSLFQTLIINQTFFYLKKIIIIIIIIIIIMIIILSIL